MSKSVITAFLFPRLEDYCGSPDSVCEEVVRCDDFDSVLPQCICFNRATAVHGESKEQVCHLAH